MLDAFASRAAEDLLEPLDAIAGFLELLVERHPGVLDADGAMLVTRAAALATRQRDRVASLLEYAEAGSVTVDFEAVELRAATRGSPAHAPGCRSEAATVQIAVGSQSEVPGDSRQLVRLLELLIDRAIRGANGSTE